MIAIVVGGLLALCMAGTVVIAIFAPSGNRGATNTAITQPTSNVTASVPAGNPAPVVSAAQPSAAASAMAPAATGPASAVQTATVPNLVGINAAVAQDQLKRLGFTNIEFGSVDAADTVVIMVSNWTVAKQSTAPGTKAPLDQLVVLSCTKHP